MSAGGDAFVQDWSEGFGYFHLPVVLVFKMLDKARGARPRASWWCLAGLGA